MYPSEKHQRLTNELYINLQSHARSSLTCTRTCPSQRRSLCSLALLCPTSTGSATSALRQDLKAGGQNLVGFLDALRRSSSLLHLATCPVSSPTLEWLQFPQTRLEVTSMLEAGKLTLGGNYMQKQSTSSQGQVPGFMYPMHYSPSSYERCIKFFCKMKG